MSDKKQGGSAEPHKNTGTVPVIHRREAAAPAAGRGKQRPAAKAPASRRPRAATAARHTTGSMPAVRPGQEEVLPGAGGVAVLPRRRRPNPLVLAIGNWFYALGFAAEYHLLQLWRRLRDVGIFVGQLLGWLFGSLWQGLSRMFRGIWRDLSAPLRRWRKRRRQLHRLRERAKKRGLPIGKRPAATLARVGMKNTAQLMLQAATYLLPVLAAGVLVFAVWQVTGYNYALAVMLNGKQIGYVADQSVVEGAKGLLRERISLAPNQNLQDWQLTPSYAIARTDQLTTTQQLADEILRNSTQDPNDIMEATGLTIDGQLYAVTTEGEQLQAYLNGLLQAEDPGTPGVHTGFSREVVLDDADDHKLYFSSSVEDFDAILNRLDRNVSEDETTLADGEATLGEIAHNNELTMDLLQQRNPQYAQAEEDFIPEAGEEILLRRAEPFLQVQTVVRTKSTEPIPFERVEEYDDGAAAGTIFPLQEGVEGEREVWDDVYYVDGEEVGRERIDELTVEVRQPVDEIVRVGTYSFGGETPTGEFGAYFFPVPASTWSSRGIGGHRGMDINAPEGTAIFASNAGEVITAGWHYSYGWYVMIQHPDGMITLYGHCSSLSVAEGDKVERGQYIAAVGSTGVSTGPHLHLEFQPNGIGYVDPLLYITPPEGYRMDWRR